MLRLATQGVPDRLGDQIAAALHGKGRRVVRMRPPSRMQPIVDTRALRVSAVAECYYYYYTTALRTMTPHQVDLAPDLAPDERADEAEKVCLDAGLVPKY